MIQSLETTNEVIAKQVLEVQHLAYLVEAQIIGFDGIPALNDTVASIQKSEEEFYGYYLGADLAGVISFSIINETLAIHRLVVHPKFFRKGIGKALVKHVLEQEKSRVNRYEVWTGSANLPAIKLYKGFGFVEVKQRKVHSTIYITKLEMKIHRDRENK